MPPLEEISTSRKRLDTELSPEASLFSDELGARLNRLTLLARRLPETRQRARRRSRQLGQGTERVDTRDYVPGDDPRRIAWTVYARLERLLTWIVAEEEPLRVLLLVDTSASMAFGTPSKLTQAKRIAAGIAAIALAAEDRVAAVAAPSTSGPILRSIRGRRALPRLLNMLESLEPAGETDLTQAALSSIPAAGGRGLCIILSDFFDAQGPLAGARALRALGHDVALLQILDPLELEPPDLDGLVIEDSETGELIELSPTGTREAYRRALQEQLDSIQTAAAEIGAPFMRVTAAEVFDDVVTRALAAGLIKTGSVS